MRKILGISVASLAAFVLLTGQASAALTRPRLSFVRDGGASIGWSSAGGSSPADPYPNTRSLRVFVPAGGGASAYTYGRSEALIGIRGLTLAQIDHLGFDSKGYLGAGAPRISLGTTGTDGAHTYFLSAFYCNDSLSGGWRTSDFVHDTTNCTIWRDGTTELTWAAAEVLAGANNEHVVESPNDWFFIQDEPTPAQGGSATVYVDRLTVQDWMWVRGGARGAKNCNSGNCI
jgi:hypothetical protein